jgi:hypothetical protein
LKKIIKTLQKKANDKKIRNQNNKDQIQKKKELKGLMQKPGWKEKEKKNKRLLAPNRM